MRLRKVQGAEEKISESPFCIKDPAEKKGQWKDVFKNKAPIHLEIGMGKGKFLLEKAMSLPKINFLGLELHESVLVRGVEKQEEAELDNLLFLRENAECIEEFFEPGEIGHIYLNFSDPWPKDRHKKRRLTGGVFLARYDRLLPAGGIVEFKTDNKDLFDFSLEEAENSPFRVDTVSYDLHSDPVLSQGNIMTEYEERFSAKGNPICYLRLVKGE